MRRAWLMSLVLAFCSGEAARAADPMVAAIEPAPAAQPLYPSDYDEVRLGVFYNQFVGPRAASEASASVNGEVVVRNVFGRGGPGFLDFLLHPRLHIGVIANTAARTSYGYAGGTWTYDLTDRIFLDVGLGGALSNGAAFDDGVRLTTGCALAFHETFSAGYRITRSWDAMVTFTHISNGGLCPPNHGLNTIGLRSSYRF